MILNLWSVPVYKENTDHTWSRFSEEQKNKLLELQKEKLGVVVPGKGVLLDDPIFKDIKELIHTHALKYKNEIMLCDNDLDWQSSWFTVNKKGDNHEFHKHRHTIFSVCYYPRAETGSLVLIAPGGKNTWQQEYRMGFKYSKYNEWNSADWSIPVLSGDIVIFPGWVSHLTTPNESEKSRLMIGANYWLKGHMQFFDDLDSITI